MSIQRTLNKSLLLPIFSLVLVAVLIVGYVTHQTANAQLERRIQTLADSSSVLFEDLLWQFDYETLQVLLDEYIALGAVSNVQISGGPRIELQAGNAELPESAYVLTRELLHRDGGAIQQIGTLTLQASREGVWERVKARTIETLAIALLAALATAFIIHRLLHERLVEPVLTIANSLDGWDGDWQNFEIDLNSSGRPDPHAEDELDRLVSSIHGMRDQILTASRIIESKDARLLSAARIAGIGYASIEFENGEIVECDEQFAQIFGCRADEMLGLSFREDILRQRLHADDFSQAMEVRQQLILGNAAEVIFRVASDTGEYRHIRQLYDVYPSQEGLSCKVHTVAQDVTEFNRLQSTLVQAQKTRTIGNLTGGVAHDFNNILAVISGNLELLEDSHSDASDSARIRTCLQAVQHGADLTHQLLAFARQQPLRPEVVDPSRLIRDSLSLMRTSVGESVELEVVSDGGLWRLEVDRTQLEAAILNLVINARDAMPDGGKLTIDVSNARLDATYAELHEEVRPGQYVCIAVTDTGSGMSANTISQALEPFFTTKDVGKGTGLGLPMAYGFVKQSGGHLKIYSELDRGTTVKLYLPRVNALQEVVRPEVVGPSAARFAGLQVLLVEDNDDLRKTITMQLEKLGAIVQGAPDGPSAFLLAPDTERVDLVLCDVVLPNGIRGPEVVARLQKFYPTAAIIYMSGYTENAIIHQGRLDDGVVMLQKPFSRRELLAAFARASESVEEVPEI